MNDSIISPNGKPLDRKKSKKIFSQYIAYNDPLVNSDDVDFAKKKSWKKERICHVCGIKVDKGGVNRHHWYIFLPIKR